MAISDASGLPVAAIVERASPHEGNLVHKTLNHSFLQDKPTRLIGDKAYDSDPLDAELMSEHGVEMIAPHRAKRTRTKTQDGRKLRRYARRWKIERLFVWLQNDRRVTVRYEYHVRDSLAMGLLACSGILLRLF